MFRTHSFLLENLKKVLKNHHFLEKIRKFVFAHLYSLALSQKRDYLKINYKQSSY